MIFVSYGTQPHNFNRLSQIVNDIDDTYTLRVQLGESQNTIKRPRTIVEKYTESFDELVKSCDILITHGGVGSIMSGLKIGKKVIVVPRLKDYGEHIDNHQLEVTNKLASGGYIYKFEGDEDINQVIKTVLTTNFKEYQSNTSSFVADLEKIIRGERE